jgi:hypothetical protein
MDELTKVWQVWNRTKINCRLECDKHKNVRANRVETGKKNIYMSFSDVFKVEHCGSSLLTSNRKNKYEKKLLISKQNRKQKKCCESCS